MSESWSGQLLAAQSWWRHHRRTALSTEFPAGSARKFSHLLFPGARCCDGDVLCAWKESEQAKGSTLSSRNSPTT